MIRDTGDHVTQQNLAFVLLMAVDEMLPGTDVTIEHALSNGLYCEIHKEPELNDDDVCRLEEKMRQIIAEKRIIHRREVPLAEAIELFSQRGRLDQVKLLKQKSVATVSLFSCGNIMEYNSVQIADNTGVLPAFTLQYWQPGLIIRYSKSADLNRLPRFVAQPKLFQVFREAEEWGRIMRCSYVYSLNEHIQNGGETELIHVAEALHEKKIAQIADFISSHLHQVRLILIAGPSSSGKTTFAQRLSIQLRVNGLRPVPISLDDYFVEREKTPLDKAGRPDYESLEAIDLELFNHDLASLLAGEAVSVPTFDFFSGRRKYNGRVLQLEPDQPLVVEGIHGLNERLTQAVARPHKIKIYISALTQLAIDRHHRIATTDARLIRRIVRDSQFRGHDALRSLHMWPFVRRGEEKNIFPFQESADVMFNSALIYELAVLKKYAEPLLANVDSQEPEYAEAQRLLHFLSYFRSIPDRMVPANSILREFIGESCFFEET